MSLKTRSASWKRFLSRQTSAFFGKRFVLCFFLWVQCLWAETIYLPPNAHLPTYLKGAKPHDVLILPNGQWKGNFIIEQPLTLKGSGQTILNAEKKGHVLHLKSPEIRIENLILKNSGQKISAMDSGIFIDKKANHSIIKNNQLENNLFGIYVWGGTSALVENNTIIGLDLKRLNDRGNGINLWNSPDTIIRGNKIYIGRDGIFTNNSKNNLFEKNEFRDLRFAVHYMYTEHSEVSHNYAENVDASYVIMFSNWIKVKNNKSASSKEHGLLLNSVNYSEIYDNQIENAEKCSFLYNANQNNFHHNEFKNCEIGIHLTAGSENNQIHHNAFINNPQQVMYVGTRLQEWSHQNKGNYWSDNSGFDLNGDGISDTPYQPNDVLDQIVWRAPNAKVLISSPSVQLLKYMHQQFPAIYPGGAKDSYPLMRSPIEKSN